MYNSLRRLLYVAFIEPLLREAKQQVARLITGSNICSLLEVGCGTGLQAVLIAKRGVAVTAVDISDGMFPRRSSRLPSTLSFRQADGRSLPLADKQFDAALISLALHEMEPESRPAVLREMSRALKPDSRLLILDYDFRFGESSGFARRLIRIMERLAGRRHHAHFRDFIRHGGIPGLAQELGGELTTLFRVLGEQAAVFELRLPRSSH